MALSQPAVANKMRLMKLSVEERAKIHKAGLTERHARAFLRIKTKQDRLAIIDHTISRHLNVIQTERYVSTWLEQQLSPSTETRTEDTNAIVCSNMEKYLGKIAAEHPWLTMQKTRIENKTVILLTFECGVDDDSVEMQKRAAP